MFKVTVVMSVTLALILVGSGIGKLMRAAPVVANLSKDGVPDSAYTVLAMLEFAAALGLLAGLWVLPIGVAAAIGVVLYFVGAVVFHVRAKDSNIGAPIVLGLLGVAILTLRLVVA